MVLNPQTHSPGRFADSLAVQGGVGPVGGAGLNGPPGGPQVPVPAPQILEVVQRQKVS